MTKNPFKLYRRSQEIQLTWIRNHKFQYIALNAILLGLWFGYEWYQDRKFQREVDECEVIVPE